MTQGRKILVGLYGTVNRCNLRWHVSNENLLENLSIAPGERLAIEMIAPIGMRVGAETFETAYWVGRFCQVWAPRPFTRITRREVKTYLCGTQRCGDKEIREAIIRKFYGPHVDTRKTSWDGVLAGINTHMWSALAVALTWENSQKRP